MKRCLLIFLLGFHFFLGVSQNIEINANIQSILNSEAFDYASVGISVRSLDGKEIVNINSDKKLIPASSQKLITNFTALDI